MKILDELKEKLGEEVFTEELAQEFKAAINEMVETRLVARENELRAEALEEASREYEQELEEYDEALQEEITRFVQEEQAKLEEERAEFKEQLVDEVSDFLESELEEHIPEETREAVAKVALYEPIVEGIRDLFAENYLRLDEEQYGVLEEARREIIKLREEKSELIRERVQLRKQLREQKREEIIERVCAELTTAQAKRFRRMVEGFDVDELEERWETIVDMVLENERTSRRRPTRRRPRKDRGASARHELSDNADTKEGVSVAAQFRESYDAAYGEGK